jgi:hypothetical protein
MALCSQEFLIVFSISIGRPIRLLRFVLWRAQSACPLQEFNQSISLRGSNSPEHRFFVKFQTRHLGVSKEFHSIKLQFFGHPEDAKFHAPIAFRP